MIKSPLKLIILGDAYCTGHTAIEVQWPCTEEELIDV